MRPKNEQAVCDFVRSILSVAVGAPVTVTGQPDREDRSKKNVEELWAAGTNSFAIEHTLLESFVGQLVDDAKFVKLIAPLEQLLAGQLPGTYSLTVEAGVSAASRLRYDQAHRLMCAAILRTAPTLAVGASIELAHERIPFPFFLYRRSEKGSRILVRRSVSDVEPSRLDRVRRALEAKCPKLKEASVDDRVSVLALESNDIALANYNVVGLAVKQALAERSDCPNIVFVVETDGGLFYAWLVHNDTSVPLEFSYTEGEF
jgi:hypothetical protein